MPVMDVNAPAHPPRRHALLNSWRSLRHEEARRLAQLHPLHAAAMLHALDDPSTIWRFPWPDEDLDAAVINVEAMLARQPDRCFAVALPDELRGIALGIAHQPVRRHSSVDRRAPVAMGVECPAQPRRWSLADSLAFKLDVVGVRLIAGEVRTVLACPHCQATIALDAADARRLAGRLQRHQIGGWVGTWITTVAERIASLTPPSSSEDRALAAAAQCA